jgi:hypothetical protein
MFQTLVGQLRRVLSSLTASRCSSFITQSYPAASSMRVVCQTRSSVGLKIALLLELGKHLPHSIYPKGLRGRAPEHGLSSRRHRHLKHSKLHTHLSMVGGSKLHSLMQGGPLWGADYGQAQLRPLDLQKGKLLDQGLTLPLGLSPSSIGVSRLVSQAHEFCLG